MLWLSMRVSYSAIFFRFPKPVKKALDLEDRFEPSMTEISVSGKSHFLAMLWIDLLSSSSSSGLNLLKSGRIKQAEKLQALQQIPLEAICFWIPRPFQHPLRAHEEILLEVVDVRHDRLVFLRL